MTTVGGSRPGPAALAVVVGLAVSSLVVIGLDPYDDKEDNLPDFLAKRDVDYTVLYASREIAKTYRVSGYPTMFLIDKEGKIIHIQEGYGEGTEARLEEIILNQL